MPYNGAGLRDCPGTPAKAGCAALLQHTNGNLVTPANPAHWGELLLGWAYGLGNPRAWGRRDISLVDVGEEPAGHREVWNEAQAP